MEAYYFKLALENVFNMYVIYVCMCLCMCILSWHLVIASQHPKNDLT